MGNVVIKVDYRDRGLSGRKTIEGTLTLAASYSNAAGDALNLSNEFKSSAAATVILGSDDGYVLKATPGRNADNQLIQAYQVGTAINSTYQALSQVLNTTDLSGVNVSFTAIGQPY